MFRPIWSVCENAVLSISTRGLCVSVRATERGDLWRARDHVSDEPTRRHIESGAESFEFDPYSAVPEPQDYSDDPLSIFTETLPAIRNTYAHRSSVLHSTVLGFLKS